MQRTSRAQSSRWAMTLQSLHSALHHAALRLPFPCPPAHLRGLAAPRLPRHQHHLAAVQGLHYGLAVPSNGQLLPPSNDALQPGRGGMQL